MLMPLFRLETNPIMNMTERSVVLDVCEKIFGSLCIALMTFIVRKDATLFSIFIVVLPPLYYVAIGLLRQNVPLTITGAVFLIVHFTHVLGNLKG